MAPKAFKLMSPRLPGVQILNEGPSRAQYQKWRRSVCEALTNNDTWGHCDGTSTCPMPMPAGRISLKEEPQPGLLEERRAWVKKDRDVKLDIFLSIHDEIKMDVFDVGPPLPPSALTAKEMLEALDERFASFKFEDFHHIYCHFLNLHIDQFRSLAEFNAEFTAVLQEMNDHGYPLHNIQACSAYFSKLRCTQNPWVVRKLQEWADLTEPPLLSEVLAQAPPWIVIRPLATKSSLTQLAINPPTPGDSDTDYMSEMLEDLAEENESLNSPSHTRSTSSGSTASSSHAEITIHASADLQEIPRSEPRDIPRSAPRDIPRSNTNPTINTTFPPTPPRNPRRRATTTASPKDRPLPPLPIEALKPTNLEKAELPATRSLEIPRVELPAMPSPIELPASPVLPATPPPCELPATPESYQTWPRVEEDEGRETPESDAWSLPLQGIPEVSPISPSEKGMAILGLNSKMSSLRTEKSTRRWSRRGRPSPIKV